MNPGSGEILIQTTINHEEKAVAFARGMVERRLAACVTRIPGCESIYRWETDDLTVDTEQLLLIKSHRDKLREIEAYFKEAHPYEVPELLVFDVDQVSAGYAGWLRKETGLL